MKGKRLGRRPVTGVSRLVYVTLRVSPDEKEVIRRYFGSYTAVRDFLVDLVKVDKASDNANVTSK